MKNKFLTPEERRTRFETEEKLIFSDTFPFETLSIDPKNTICVAWHWSDPDSMTTTGTAYTVRVGIAPPLKCDVYSFQPNSDGGAVIEHVNKTHIKYHHTNKIEDLPLFIREQAPPEILTKIKKVFEKTPQTN